MTVVVKIEGLAKLKAAIARNPQKIKSEVKNFLQRGMAIVKSIVRNDPWRVGMDGGGAPAATGKMRDTHQTVLEDFKAAFKPDLGAAPYAGYVHGGTSKMEKRPWLEYAERAGRPEINTKAKEMMTAIADNLAA